ncbi:hypothetical protein BCR35DRAFT_304051 [Leucosporidium creatinivorum]|uniref:BTB domain-containing protein n=1 Tax=Leucosporidium creatinivorum TaxID=106004 RepID=A0A1Y2FC63_9BASI|nr:hypothetical protein BCR35DRAFT_304051 [Leucosporidium creatinivorum]
MLSTIQADQADSPILSSRAVNVSNTQARTAAAPSPTHQLLITFDDSAQPLLLPIHGLVWALASPLLSTIASGHSEGSPIPITLPSSSSFHLLHTWIYLECIQALLHPLLAFSDEEETSRASPNEIVALCSLQEEETLLDRLELLSGLYRNALALRVGDTKLWSAMGGAWRILVDAWQVSRRRGRGGSRD